MKIVVIGGSGLIGSKLVPKLREHGHEAVAASPESGVNTLTGEGLADALKGASVVVDVSNSPSWEDNAVMEFFETSTRNLLAYEAAAGVGHHVALSVVGSERLLESGYFRAKIAQENLIKSSSIPYSIVRATQFFEFIKGIADFATDGNTVRLPSALIQPMAADDVASAVCRVALGSPLNGADEIGGPEQFRLYELVRRALAARNDPREVVADPQAPYYGIKVSETTLIPGSDARLGETRFETWLSQSANQIPATTRQPEIKNAAGSKLMASLKLLMLVLPLLVSSKLMAQEAKVTTLMSKDLTEFPGKEGMMITVDYPPGSTDPVHRHNAHAFVYVLEGSIVMQVKGGKEVTLTRGQTFHEGPNDVHVVGRNASNTRPAKFVVFFVKDKGAPVLIPIK